MPSTTHFLEKDGVR